MSAVPMAVAPVAPARWLTRRQWVTWLLFGAPLLALAIWGIVDNDRLFFTTLLNALTLASLYFLVASGFTLVFGLMRSHRQSAFRIAMMIKSPSVYASLIAHSTLKPSRRLKSSSSDFEDGIVPQTTPTPSWTNG